MSAAGMLMLQIEMIRSKSEIMAELEREGKIMIVGAMYDVATGGVEFLDGAAA